MLAVDRSTDLTCGGGGRGNCSATRCGNEKKKKKKVSDRKKTSEQPASSGRLRVGVRDGRWSDRLDD